jgi:hydroxylaminobenzene mutase
MAVSVRANGRHDTMPGSGKTGQALLLFRSGTALLLLGIISGLTTTLMANPRMGLSAHVEGLLNGILLIALGAAWTAVELPHGLKRVALLLLVAGSWTNWAATQLAAFWGTGKLTPIVGVQMTGTAIHEAIVSTMLVVVVALMSGGLILVMVGFCQRPAQSERDLPKP